MMAQVKTIGVGAVESKPTRFRFGIWESCACTITFLLKSVCLVSFVEDVSRHLLLANSRSVEMLNLLAFTAATSRPVLLHKPFPEF